MRELHTARLVGKQTLSEPAQCFHLTFSAEPGRLAPAEPGQFFSLVAPDAEGKPYTRAYSVASATQADAADCYRFDLCVNRVESGFFSNLLCDLESGAAVSCHGPHGLFTLRPGAAGYLFIAESTGIAPIRSFLQTLSAAGNTATARLLYWAPSTDELFYDDELRALAAQQPWFTYVPVLATNPGDYAPLLDSLSPPGELEPYVCGLGTMVRLVRERLLSLGWARRDIQSERYD